MQIRGCLVSLLIFLEKMTFARLRKIAFGYDEDSYEERYYCSEEFKNCRKCYRYAPKELEGL